MSTRLPDIDGHQASDHTITLYASQWWIKIKLNSIWLV